jgi:hypothetical protein
MAHGQRDMKVHGGPTSVKVLPSKSLKFEIGIMDRSTAAAAAVLPSGERHLKAACTDDAGRLGEA